MAKRNRAAKAPACDVAHGVMRTQDVRRRYDELIKRFKEIQTRFENAQTEHERKAALAAMQKLSDETHALLSNRPARFTGA